MNSIPRNLNHRKATLNDLSAIVGLLSEEDELGCTREQLAPQLDQRYVDAFHKIEADPSHYLMVVEMSREIVGTCHLTLLPSLTLMGQTRLQMEAVRVSKKYRGQGIGQWMVNEAAQYARSHGVSIIQLTTNKKRGKARKFYERLGFEASHEGMKLSMRKGGR